jgi:phosphohistidine phosphatase
MTAYMREAGYLAEVVLCSTAQRARQTLDLLLPAWTKKPAVRYDRGLYLVDWPQLLAVLRKVTPPRASPLLLVGHNPGIEQLAIALAREPAGADERARLQAMGQKFPTAALAVLDFDIATWRSLKPAAGQLVDYVRPKDLAPESGIEDE